MPAPFLYFVVLECLRKINGERTIYSIYHLLSGKKSSQTIQDAHLFQLNQYFKTYSFLSREELDDIVKELELLELVSPLSDFHYRLTEKGLNIVKTESKKHDFLLYLNGWHYQRSDSFWERLSLLVQVTSNLARNETNYMPIQRNKNIQNWLKGFLRGSRLDRSQLSRNLYGELVECLEEIEGIDPAILIIRLTGYHAIGLTEKQACEILNLEETLYHYQFHALLHFMMEKVKRNSTNFPLLISILDGLHTLYPLTESTKKTFELLSKGFTVEQIGKIRNLKISTIQDHIVELALQMEEFSIEPFVDNELIEKIILAKNKSTSKQLKHIREFVPDANYFEIRLVMTKYGEES